MFTDAASASPSPFVGLDDGKNGPHGPVFDFECDLDRAHVLHSRALQSALTAPGAASAHFRTEKTAHINLPAAAIFARSVQGRIPDFYQRGDDCIIYVKTLGGPS